MKINNQKWLYTLRPDAKVSKSNYTLEEDEVLDSDDLQEGELIIKSLYFSVDPYMRIQQSAKDSWEAPHPLNSVQLGGVVGEVIAINDKTSNLVVRDKVLSYSGWQSYAKCKSNEVTPIDESLIHQLSYALSILGMPGRTAYFGLFDAGRPKPGETLIVSGAAGAVGSIVAQLGCLAGCNVIGIVGGEEKCQYLKERLGVNAVIDYKKHDNLKAMNQAIQDIATDGIDVYFDNVGGYITDAVINNINVRARIVICGQISQYSGGLDHPELGPRFLHKMLYKRATLQGILARDFANRNQEMISALSKMLKAGEIQYNETVINGFHNLPTALAMLFEGKNTGKLIVKA
ncbi:NADP-dependent oxidoreductase [Fangia hongkongensis]|uniref:NADP-dependent oxidoreductase n=1 Tax=Fangia hongkongensis TaxID=270495 RepID=UPI000380D998|nr:NADP-dependent oxidoreductase [Fangia hongkongensis]MBK2123645.1 NADP-dependent oxidoreductase [Fangia hongkongensis]